jgi:hypothetical protein
MPLNSAGGNSAVNGVRQFWFLLMGLAGALVMIGVAVAPYVIQNQHLKKSHPLHLSPVSSASVIVVVGLIGQVLVRSVNRPLNGSSDVSLLASFRARFFLWVGVGDVPAFVGLALALASDRFWLYPVGVAFALVSYAHIAPTGAHLARDQEQLNRSGNRRSLIEALATMPGRRPRR